MDRFDVLGLLSNSFIAVIALVVLLVIFHALFIYIRASRLNEKGWKIVDYIWLGCAAFGLIFLSSDARTSLADIWSPIEQRYTDATFRAIKSYADDAENSYFCTHAGQRTKNSPPELELISQDFRTACKWRQELDLVVNATLKNEHPKLTFHDIPSATFHDEGFIDSELQWLEEIFQDYRRDVVRLRDTQSRAELTAWELLLKLTAPILICIALALRITKVTAELRNVNRKAK